MAFPRHKQVIPGEHEIQKRPQAGPAAEFYFFLRSVAFTILGADLSSY